MKKQKPEINDWHSGFASALKLEFMEEQADLEYERENLLNAQPLRIDLLIIKKKPGYIIKNSMGRLFRKYNIVEYKSPEDVLNIDVFAKVCAYAFLYKSYGKTVDERSFGEITISMVREAKPIGLFDRLKDNGFHVAKKFSGVYWVTGSIPFPAQIIVTRELAENAHLWVRSLARNLDEKELRKLIQKTRRLKDDKDKQLANDVWQVAARANQESVDKLKGANTKMFEALMEIMKPDIDAVVAKECAKARAEARAEAIAETEARVKTETEIQMILDMKKEGSTLEFIAKIVKKPLEEVQRVIQNNMSVQ